MAEHETSDPLVGTLLGERYLVQELVGEGGMGRVYLGQHLMMRKRIALKVIHPQLLHVEEVVARFEREAVAAGHIEHPNAVAAMDFGRTGDGSLFLVMEYVEGRRLDDLLKAGRLEVPRAVHVTRQVLRALRRAHTLGIVHRDIKPENVLLVERDGDPDFVKVLDFGIAKMTLPEGQDGAPLTQMGMVYGTPEYLSPEQATGSAVDARADLYSVGVLLYEMLAGRRPFSGGSPVELLGQHVTAAVPAIADVAPEARVPASLEALVQRLLAKLPEQRPSGAAEVLEALDGLEGARGAMGALGHAPTAAAVHPAHLPAKGREPSLAEAARTFARVAAVEARRLAVTLSALARRSPLAAVGIAAGLVLLVATPIAVLSAGEADGAGESDGETGPAASPLEREPATAPAPPAPREPARAGPVGQLAPQGAAPAPAGSDSATPYSLGSSLADAGELVSALAHYRSALQLRPAYADDPKLRADVVRALGDRRAQEAAKTLIRVTLRDRVADDLADAVASSRPLLRRNARSLLEEILPVERWPARVRALQELRAASSCSAKKAIVVRMRQAGDPRVLPVLRELREQRRGCGFLGMSDCNACLRPELAATIDALQTRPPR
jgi:serine/threonine-protein kinase